MLKETLFGPYRPYCAALASAPSQKIFLKLQNLIDNEENDEVIQILQDYILFPHQVYLRAPSLSENYTILTLNAIENILKRINIDSTFLFKDLLSIIMKLKLQSDDIKIVLSSCLKELFRSSMKNKIIPFTEDNHRYELSHVIFTLLTFTEETNESHLIASGLGAIDMIISVYSSTKFIEPMLPGILSRLMKVLKNECIKSHAMAQCMDLWNRTFSEYFLQDFRVDDIKSLNHISTHLKEILPYTYYENVLVRESAYMTFKNIKSLDYFVEDAVEFAAAISSRNPVQEIRDWINSSNESRIQTYVFAQIHSMTEVFKNCELYRLHGFLYVLQLLDKSLASPFFKSESYLKPFLRTLIRLGRIELNTKVSYIYVKSEAMNFGYVLSDVDEIFEMDDKSCLKEKEYVYLKYDQIEVYNKICNQLSYFEAIDEITGCLLELLSSDTEEQVKRDCLSLIPKILNPNLNSFILEELADYFLQNKVFPEEICECLIVLITVAPLSIRTDYMSDVLSYVLTRTLDRNLIKFALNKFSKIEGCDCILQFLESNSRPLCQTLFIHLRKLQTEDVPLVLLSIVFKLKNDASNLRDVFSLLLSQLDISWLSPDKSFTTKILQIIKASVDSVNNCNDEIIVPNQLELKKSSNFEIGGLTKLVAALMKEDEDLAKLREVEVDYSSPNTPFSEPGEDEDEMGDEEEEGVQISPEQSYLRKCIVHTRHFVSMVRCPRWQILSMEIILSCIKTSNLPDDELLPLVHQIWQPLKLLFESDNIFVVDRAFSLLNILAQTSKDFIRRRSEQDVFPHIIMYLSRLKSLKASKEGSSLIITKQATILLDKMMKGLWNFTALLDLDEKSVGKLVRHIDDIGIGEEGFFKPLRDIDEDVLYYYRLLKGNA
uniref:TELO2interacting protein 1 homolog [Ceratitis capitata] n=1 Tax=Lepeophtheirus salmonis TaxID=72036 RepID=A0A0K2TTF3_LEPSM|nr:uncharacterized protein LOC121130073 [Lepeophtheirus salmonis]